MDGPGSRLVIFFQGCNFQCQSCHNPYTIGDCNHCGDCIPGCPGGALSLDSEDRIQWLSDLCTQCDKCLDICPISASPKASSYTVTELLRIIRDKQPLINGITLSGGEATLQLAFIIDLLKTLKADPQLGQLNCLLDTNGSLSRVEWDRLLPFLDGVTLDLKAWDDERHRKLTGSGNNVVMQSLDILAAANKLVEVRLLMIPGQTDFEEQLGPLSKKLRELPAETTIRINAFQHHGVRGAAQNWPNANQHQVESFAHQLQAAGVAEPVLPSIYLENLYINSG